MDGDKKKKPSSRIEDDEEYRCGVGPFKPDCIQPLASEKVYMVSYAVLSLLQGTLWTYLIAVLTTIEKRFAMSSKASGFSMTGAEYSNILAALFVAYFGNKGHRPRWISVGMYLCALSCFFVALPEFLLPGNTALIAIYTNASSRDVCRLPVNDSHELNNKCDSDDSPVSEDSSAFTATALIFTGMFINGIGAVPLYTLAWTFLDDSVPKQSLPVYLGISMSLRAIGPALGYILGGITLTIYHDLGKTPDFDLYDPRWVGAWWLGFVFISIAICLTAFTMYLFPKELPSQKKRRMELTEGHEHDTHTLDARLKDMGLPSIKDLPKAVKSILTNWLFMAAVFESVIYWLGFFGFITFLPKYMESQFGKSASAASFITGLTTVFVMMFGFLSSGLIIGKFKPRARTLSAFSLCTGLVQVSLLLLSILISCEENVQLYGSPLPDRTLDLIEQCNYNCDCTTEKFTPVCDVNSGVTYFSACHTGCVNYNETDLFYSDCACLPPSNTTEEAIMEIGKCPNWCTTFITYISMISFIRFLSSTERVGGSLIFLRSVRPSERNLALGVANILFCLFAFIPCSVLFGALIDTTCLVWEEGCDGSGNCWFYDADRFRYWLHGFSAALLLVSNSFQVYIWFHAKHLKLYEESPENPLPEQKDLLTNNGCKSITATNSSADRNKQTDESDL